jgi:hypothetical protein
MSDIDIVLKRLLHAAAATKDDRDTAAPFGFATRVVAQWRSGSGAMNGNGIARLIRRVALIATVVIVISTAGAVREFTQTRELGEPTTNEFAIADSLIDEEVSQ